MCSLLLELSFARSGEGKRGIFGGFGAFREPAGKRPQPVPHGASAEVLPRRRQVALGDLFFRSLRLAFCLLWVLEEDALSPNLEGAGPETERNIEFWGEGCDRGREFVRRRDA